MEILSAAARKLELELSPKKLDQFRVYYRELVGWNRKVNLTGITDPREVQVKHFLDSLTVSLVMPDCDISLNVIDIGTGAGLPGIPLKIVFPDISLTLLEATAKKSRFLKHVVGVLGLEDVAVLTDRAEELAYEARYREKFDVVLSRAVASLATLAELTLPFCATGGVVVAQKKGDINEELNQASPAINLLGGKLREIKSVTMAEFDDIRRLVVISKITPTPPQYPRRPGVPAKRPIT